MREGQPSALISGPATRIIVSRHGTRARDPYPLPPKSCWTVRLPEATRLFSHRGDVGQKNLFSEPPRPIMTRARSEPSRWTPQRGMGPKNDQDSRTQASPGPRSTVAPIRPNLNEIPTNGIPRFPQRKSNQRNAESYGLTRGGPDTTPV